MSESKFTSGPWAYTLDSTERGADVSADQGRIGICNCGPEDAPLIAAAPDLLEALKDMFALLDEGLLVRDTSKDEAPGYAINMLTLVRRLNKAKQAIERATK